MVLENYRSDKRPTIKFWPIQKNKLNKSDSNWRKPFIVVYEAQKRVRVRLSNINNGLYEIVTVLKQHDRYGSPVTVQDIRGLRSRRKV